MDVEITIHVNGAAHRVVVDSCTMLLNALRERLGLTGTKKGSDHDQCGACCWGEPAAFRRRGRPALAWAGHWPEGCA
jgi:hypothetical protein